MLRGAEGLFRLWVFWLILLHDYEFDMDVTTATAENAGEMVKDELAEKCQKLFQAFLEE